MACDGSGARRPPMLRGVLGQMRVPQDRVCYSEEAVMMIDHQRLEGVSVPPSCSRYDVLVPAAPENLRHPGVRRTSTGPRRREWSQRVS